MNGHNNKLGAAATAPSHKIKGVRPFDYANCSIAKGKSQYPKSCRGA
jgi:hypothetical protein